MSLCCGQSGLNVPPITCDILFDNLQNGKSFNRFFSTHRDIHKHTHFFMDEKFLLCSFFVHLHIASWHVVIRSVGFFFVVHTKFTSNSRWGRFRSCLNFLCACTTFLLLLSLPFFFSIPFNNFINYAFSSLTNNIANVFAYSLSNDLKSIKCCRTLKWYFTIFILFYIANTHIYACICAYWFITSSSTL